jgi:hypothetical protein
MNKTVYCIQLGKSPKVLLLIADNNKSLNIINGHADVDKSMTEMWVELGQLPLIKTICKDTRKTALLNRTHTEKSISDITNEVLGCDVTWKNITFNAWNDFMINIDEYTRIKRVRVEIDHPIDFRDKELQRMINVGNKSKEKFRKELDDIRKKFKKVGKKKNGNG